MTLILLFVLVGTVWLLLPAAASSLYFDFSDLSVKPDESLELPCGVEGDFRHCVWETERGEVFQVEDVHAGLHPGMRASSNLTHNQCGIIVDALTERSFGKWTCRVYFAGLALRAERTVGKALECPGGFTQIGTECYYVYHGVKQNWEKSREFCQSFYSTSDLAVLNDCHQFELVWNKILAEWTSLLLPLTATPCCFIPCGLSLGPHRHNHLRAALQSFAAGNHHSLPRPLAAVLLALLFIQTAGALSILPLASFLRMWRLSATRGLPTTCQLPYGPSSPATQPARPVLSRELFLSTYPVTLTDVSSTHPVNFIMSYLYASCHASPTPVPERPVPLLQRC